MIRQFNLSVDEYKESDDLLEAERPEGCLFVLKRFDRKVENDERPDQLEICFVLLATFEKISRLPIDQILEIVILGIVHKDFILLLFHFKIINYGVEPRLVGNLKFF